MKSIVKKWKKLLIVPLLCAALVLTAGCGGNSAKEAETTELPVIEENADGQETSEDRDQDGSDASAGEDEYTETGEESGENDWEEGEYTSDGEETDQGVYAEASVDSWDESGEESGDNGEYTDYDSDSGENYESGEDEYSENDEYTEDDGSGNSNLEQSYEDEYESSGGEIGENGVYTTKEDVALYLHTYGRLPNNFMTKKEARSLGWSGGSLEKYAPGMCIGGDRFGNYEGTLPDGNYHECDINTLGKEKRGAERLVYASDGRIYYTNDHYETFVLLYEKD